MKNFLKILGIALAVFFGIIYVEEGMSPFAHLVAFLKKTPIEGIQQPLPEIANELKDIIVNHNNSLVEAYERGDGNLVQNMEKGFKQFTVNEIFFARMNTPEFKPRLNNIKFLNMSVSGDVFIVRTKEDWSIGFINKNSSNGGIRAEVIKDETYHVTYQIKKIENKWRIIGFESKRQSV
ncbi:MAG: hypothetical protein HZB79_05700 [Deltaproteobacteria bacterium]|nr:hypothetical protein [Deltaproteobacteria bacterium]